MKVGLSERQLKTMAKNIGDLKLSVQKCQRQMKVFVCIILSGLSGGAFSDLKMS